MVNKIVIFDLVGSLGHFRRFYTNSSSLTYTFPPRTAVVGLIAGILGYERDTYYELFNTQNCRIAVSIKEPVRKLVQTVNYIMTKSIKDVTGSAGHTQIPIEFLLPTKDVLRYRVYFYHRDEEIFNSFLDNLQSGYFEYPAYLGITECIANFVFIGLCSNSSLKLNSCDNIKNKIFEISSVIPISKIEGIAEIKEGLQYMKEDKVPVEFDTNRRITKVDSYLYELNCRNLKVVVKDEYLQDVIGLTYIDNSLKINEYIIFM